MSDLASGEGRPILAGPGGSQSVTLDGTIPVAGQYLAALALVAGATLLAFVSKSIVAAPNLTLIYVLPVVVVAVAFGWGPSLVAVVAGVLCFDFFFTAPYFSFAIYSPADIWAAVMQLVVAAIVTSVAAQSRRRAIEARHAAERAEALQQLAHVVIAEKPRVEVMRAGAQSLHEIFRAPSVIFLREGQALRQVAGAGGPQLSSADEESARGALEGRLHTRAETYPYDAAKFEFWPVETPSDCRCVVGVDFSRAQSERPEKPERFVDVVTAYLAMALERRA